MKDTYTYKIGENLYVNLTNRCSNLCEFCVRNGKDTYEGHALWLRGGEPEAETIIKEIGDPKRFREIVFCGFGEPTYRLREILEVSQYVHEKGGKARLNTNGHGSAINGRDIAPELVGMLDGINISLNAQDKETYERICHPRLKNAYESMLLFAKRCKECGIPCWFSVVDCIGEAAVAECRKIAAGIGIPLRVRQMI